MYVPKITRDSSIKEFVGAPLENLMQQVLCCVAHLDAIVKDTLVMEGDPKRDLLAELVERVQCRPHQDLGAISSRMIKKSVI